MAIEKIWEKNYDKGVSTKIEIKNDETLNGMVEKACKKFKDKSAYCNFGVNLTFAELDEKVENLASYFQNELGLQKGDKVAVQLPNLLQNPISLFAILRAGLIVVNTNPLYTPREMQFQFKDSGAKAIIILENFLHNLEEIIDETDIKYVISTKVGDQLGKLKGAVVDFVVKYIQKGVPSYKIKTVTFNNALEIGSQKKLNKPKLSTDDIAFLQYTGGTTGRSKGAMLSHKNILINVKQVETWFGVDPVTEEDFVCSPLPLYHIFSLTCNCMTFLNIGCTNLLITNPKDMNSFTKDLIKYPVTIITGVNTLFIGLLKHKNFDKINWERYRSIVAGGTSLQGAVFEEFKKRAGKSIVEGYGLTEASPLVTCNPINPKGERNKVGTIGLPLPETEVCFLDENGNEIEKGIVGELAVRGPQVMKGYWNNKDETSKILIKDWLHTGDLGFMDNDGYIKIVDRKKDMILVSGFNVYPNEIEEVIVSHPDVTDCAVVGVEDQCTGERPIAVVVRNNDKLKEEDLRNYCKKSLTRFKVPIKVFFVEDLPKSNVGKILRRVVREDVLKMIQNSSNKTNDSARNA